MDKFTNGGFSLVAGGAGGVGTALGPTDTILHLPTGDGAKMPSDSFQIAWGSILGAHEFGYCTTRSGDTLTVIRGQEGTTAQTWAVNAPVASVFSAASANNLWSSVGTGGGSSGEVYSIKSYGAVCDGTTNDLAAWNSALAAAHTAGGGIVLHPGGVSVVNGTIVIPGDSITIRGVGDGSVIKPTSGATFDVISTPIPTSVGATGFQINYLRIENLKIDCSPMTGNVAGQGNGIHFYGARYSYIRKVFVYHSPNWAILLDGDNVSGSSGNFGYDNSVSECIFDLCNAGIWQTNCEANRFTENQFKWAGSACAAGQPAYLHGSTLGDTTPGTDTTAMHLHLGSGYAYVAGNVFGNGGTYTTPAIRTDSSGPCRIIGNRFDQVRYQAVTLNGSNHLFAFNAIGTPSKIGAGNAIQLGSSNNLVIGNQFDSTAGAYNHAWAVAESGGPFTGNVIIGNHLPAGSSGSVLTTAGSTHVEFGNTGVHSELFKGDSIPAVATGAYQVTDSDNLVYVDSTTTAFTLTLPNPRNGLAVTIKDKTGHCATNNVTISTLASATMDGAASGTVKLTTNYGVLRFVSDGANWFTL